MSRTELLSKRGVDRRAFDGPDAVGKGDPGHLVSRERCDLAISWRADFQLVPIPVNESRRVDLDRPHRDDRRVRLDRRGVLASL